MIIILNDIDKKFLRDNNFRIDYDKDYGDDEFLKLLDDLYFQEISYVGIDETKAKRYADIADKIAELD